MSKFGCRLSRSNVCICKHYAEILHANHAQKVCSDGTYVCLFMLLVFDLHSCLMIFRLRSQNSSVWVISRGFRSVGRSVNLLFLEAFGIFEDNFPYFVEFIYRTYKMICTSYGIISMQQEILR